MLSLAVAPVRFEIPRMALEPENDDDAAEAKAIGRALSVARTRTGLTLETRRRLRAP